MACGRRVRAMTKVTSMRIRSFLAVTIRLACLGAMLAGCSRPSPREQAAGAAARSLVQSPIVVPASASELAAHVRAAGRPVVLNVWATWCGPCRAEFPALLMAAQRHRDVRLLLVSTDFDNQLAEVGKFLVTQGVRDTSFHKRGPDQEFIDGLNPKWSGALPATFVYDAAGRPVTWWEGAADSARLESAISLALHARP